MIGGLSIIFLTVHIFIPKDSNLHTIGWTMFYLSFICNFPHFLISYQFLYIDNRNKILKDWRCFIAGIVVPILLIGYTFYYVSISAVTSLGYLANTMFFLVGWHYVKQIIGCVLVSSALQNFYFTKFERSTLLIHALSIWFISYLNNNLLITQYMEYGISYHTFAFPSEIMKIIYGVCIISFLLLTSQLVYKFFQTKKWLPLNSLVAFFTLHAWHIPLLYHPSYLYMIPFFHSLQYLLFSFAYVKNRFRSSTSDSLQKRKQLTKGAGLYILTCFITGALFFHFIPLFLDQTVVYNTKIFGVSLFMFAFHIFLNIHHYFIDFAIWRRSNANIRKYIFNQ